MAIYLETNALRKLKDYNCKNGSYTSIFSIFELLSGISNAKEFRIRKACLMRIYQQKLPIVCPMIDELFFSFLGKEDYNKFACEMIMDIYKAVLSIDDFVRFQELKLHIKRNDNMDDYIVAIEWLKNWDDSISEITKRSSNMFSYDDKVTIKSVYDKDGVKGLADYFAEQILKPNTVGNCPYNYILFMTAQYVVFALALLNGNTQNKNNASDLLHLLYLNDSDEFVSNDKIYKTIDEACEFFRYIPLNDEKKLSELIS